MREGGRASVRSVRSLSSPFDRSPVGLAHLAGGRAVARDYVRLAALCGLLRCGSPRARKGTGAGASCRDLCRGSPRREAPKVEATGSLPGYAFRVH
jgi:hypothetical protein